LAVVRPATLSKCGLVEAFRGKRRGYLLGREPKDISLLAIIEAVQGPLALNRCQETPPRCDKTECSYRSVWDDLQETVSNRLAAASLADQ